MQIDAAEYKSSASLSRHVLLRDKSDNCVLFLPMYRLDPQNLLVSVGHQNLTALFSGHKFFY